MIVTGVNGNLLLDPTVSVLIANAGTVLIANGVAFITAKLNELVPTLPKLSVMVTSNVVVVSVTEGVPVT